MGVPSNYTWCWQRRETALRSILAYDRLETIAEQTRRPLYHITSGELSTNVSSLEMQLQNVFKLGFRWGAVLLIDEADVLMAERDVHDLDRSAIVAGNS